MVKAKKPRSDQQLTGVDVSVQDSAASHGAQPEVTNGSRTRRAKTEALNNAVWKQLAPGAGKKRAATSQTLNKAVCKKARKNNNKDAPDATTKHVEHGLSSHSHTTSVDTNYRSLSTETPNGTVSINLPGAPKKKPTVKKSGTAKAQNVTKTNRKGKKGVQDPFVDGPVVAAETDSDNDDASNSTESIFSTDSEDDGEDDDGDTVSVNNDTENGRQIRTAADKRFATEQPVWSDQTLGNSMKGSGRDSPLGDSDKEFKNTPQAPGRKNLLIRGQVIEVTDDEDESDQDESPSARLAPPSSRPASGELQNDAGGSIWPVYTHLVKGNRDLVLSVQSFELRLVVRKAMELVEERVRFQHAFPDFVLRSVWNQKALIKACTLIRDMSPMVQAKDRYEILKERIRADLEYVAEISKSLLDPRISLLRGNTKILAVNNTRVSYGLKEGCSEQLNRLFDHSRYIYPPGVNGVGFQLNKPFENKAIIGTLHDDLFSGNNPITSKYPQQFRPTDAEPDPNHLAPSMIALAATCVYASLREWENGHRVQTHFTANLFEMIYLGHVKQLTKIQEMNVNAYNALVRCLFKLALCAENTELDNVNITDVENMATSV
ncbi:hypothetical protein JOM56_004389 [Amanita muscaria]